MNFREFVITNRKKLGLSQRELADEVGVSNQSVANWESGAASPRDRTVIHMLAKSFKVKEEEVLSTMDLFDKIQSRPFDYPTIRYIPIKERGNKSHPRREPFTMYMPNPKNYVMLEVDLGEIEGLGEGDRIVCRQSDKTSGLGAGVVNGVIKVGEIKKATKFWELAYTIKRYNSATI